MAQWDEHGNLIEDEPAQRPRRREWDENGQEVAPVAAVRPAPRAVQPQRRVGQAEDIFRSLGTGLEEAPGLTLGIFPDLRNLADEAAVLGARTGTRLAGEDFTPQHEAVVRGLLPRARAAIDLTRLAIGGPMGAAQVAVEHGPTSEQITAPLRAAIPGEPHEPQTVAGEYARTTGQFAPAVVFPGSAATRAARAIIPAVTSETGGQIGRQFGPEAEAAGRILGGVGGGIATEVGIASQAGRASRNAPLRDAQALEQEFGPLTAGERSGNTRARLDEGDLRQGLGSDQAQATMRQFDARRAEQARGNAMRIVSRGQEPISQDVGEAGQILGDELRTARQAIRDRARAEYDRAFALAKSETIPQGMNDLPSGRVQVVADDLGFEVPAPAQRAIGALERKIAEGRATQADVETARQGLNRELGTAVANRQDATEFVYARIVETLDEWQGGLVRSPEARRAMQEARGIYAEGAQLYGRRGRTELSSGHTGRMDPGGRAVDRAINTDLTGEQIIDSIVGAGRRPSQQALGAVQRIKQISEGIVYTNRGAASGVRVPGRTKVGGRTAGERRFAADDPNAPPTQQNPRGGVELPTNEIQALREGLWHRILGPVDEYLSRVQASGVSQGGLIPAQKMVTALDNALNRSGREIIAVLYTPREIAAMQRFLKYVQRIVPPPGGAHSGTAQGLYRLITGAFDKLIGFIPSIGPAIRGAAEQFGSTQAARRAIRPPRAVPPDPTNVSAPIPEFPAFAGAMGTRRLGERPIDDYSEEELEAIAAGAN